MITVKMLLPKLRLDALKAKHNQIEQPVEASVLESPERQKLRDKLNVAISNTERDIEEIQKKARDIPITSSPCRLVNETARCETPERTACIELIAIDKTQDFRIQNEWIIETTTCIRIPDYDINSKHDVVAWIDNQDKLNIKVEPYLETP